MFTSIVVLFVLVCSITVYIQHKIEIQRIKSADCIRRHYLKHLSKRVFNATLIQRLYGKHLSKRISAVSVIERRLFQHVINRKNFKLIIQDMREKEKIRKQNALIFIKDLEIKKEKTYHRTIITSFGNIIFGDRYIRLLRLRRVIAKRTIHKFLINSNK